MSERLVAPRSSGPTKPVTCVMCGARVFARLKSSSHPEAPDMIEVPFGWWVGLVAEKEDRVAELVAACSPRCTDRLFKEP